jgi:hypothetical protein
MESPDRPPIIEAVTNPDPRRSAAQITRVLRQVSPGREGGLIMPRGPWFQSPDATWMGLVDHANLAMLVRVALIGGFIIWQEATRLRVETPTGGWQTLVSPN